MSLFVRLSYSYDQLSQFWDRLEKSSDTLVVYEHNTGLKNVHCHFYVTKCEVSTDTLKNWIKKIIPDVPKTHWSFKSATDDGCITYMSKGKLEPVRANKIGLERIAELKAKWVQPADTKREVKGSKVITAYDMAVEVYNKVSGIKVNDTGDYSEYVDDYKRYVKEAMAVHHKYRKAFCEYSLRKVVQTAYSMSRGGSESLVDKMTKNFLS